MLTALRKRELVMDSARQVPPVNDKKGGLPVMVSTSSLTAGELGQSFRRRQLGAIGQSSISLLTISDDGRHRRWGWSGCASLPSSTLWVGALKMSTTLRARVSLAIRGLHDGGCKLPVMLLTHRRRQRLRTTSKCSD